MLPCDTIWRHRSGSTSAQVMACCLMVPTSAQVMACCLTVPSHYLNEWWLQMAMSCGYHMRALSLEDIRHQKRIQIYIFKIGSWANELSGNCWLDKSENLDAGMREWREYWRNIWTQHMILQIITWLRGSLAWNCSGCPWWWDVWSYNSRHQAVACITMASTRQPSSWHQCRYGSLWLYLNLWLIHPKKQSLIYLWWLMIPHILFW